MNETHEKAYVEWKRSIHLTIILAESQELWGTVEKAKALLLFMDRAITALDKGLLTGELDHMVKIQKDRRLHEMRLSYRKELDLIVAKGG